MSSFLEAPLLHVENVSKSLTTQNGSRVDIIRDMSFRVGKGEFVAIVGPSGAGKTTLLRTIAGLLTPDSGTVTYEGAPVGKNVPDSLSIVFQEYSKSLFPWLSVRKNVQYGLAGGRGTDGKRRAEQALQSVGLDGAADRYPWELSGGMQQRVAIARAIASEPRLLLMDEPLASVDALTRSRLEDEIVRLWSDLGFGALLVTHDVGEAVYMADRVLIASNRPTTLRAEITIDLERPRHQLATRREPRFLDLEAEILSYIHEPNKQHESARA